MLKRPDWLLAKTMLQKLSFRTVRVERSRSRWDIPAADCHKEKGAQTRFRIRTLEGEVPWIELRARSLFNFGDNLILAVFIDVTEE